MMFLIVCKFPVGASRFVVGALHSFAPLGYGHCVCLEVGTKPLNIFTYI